MNSINFIWDLYEHAWHVKYQELVEYKKQYGDTKVTRESTDYPNLQIWVGKQRMLYKNEELPEEKINLLNELAIDWDPSKTKWLEQYQKLVAYKEKTGNCNVTGKYSEDPNLGTWVSTQRRSYKKGTLSKDFLQLLDNIGFTWNARF